MCHRHQYRLAKHTLVMSEAIWRFTDSSDETVDVCADFRIYMISRPLIERRLGHLSHRCGRFAMLLASRIVLSERRDA